MNKFLKTKDDQYISVFISSGSGDHYFILSEKRPNIRLLDKIDKACVDEDGNYYDLEDLINKHPEWKLKVISFDSYDLIYGIN